MKDSGTKLAASAIAATFHFFALLWVGHNVGVEWAVAIAGSFTAYHLMRAQDKGHA